jgi:hypothetical protein
MASLAVASPDSPPSTEPAVKPAPDQPTVEPTDATTGSDAGGDDQAATDPTVPDGTDTASPPAAAPEPCLTHGQRVSAMAHATPPGPGHGAAVSAAARDHTGECAHDDEGTGELAENTTDDQFLPPAAPPTPPETSESDDAEHHDADGEGVEVVDSAPVSDNGHGNHKG